MHKTSLNKIVHKQKNLYNHWIMIVFSDKIEDVESSVDSQMKYNYEAIYGRKSN